MPSASFVGSRVASVSRPASSTAVSMAASDMVGSSAPLGFFDPMGFSKGPAERLNAYRESELKHGRTAMLAVVGFLTQVCGVSAGGLEIRTFASGVQVFRCLHEKGSVEVLVFVALGFLGLRAVGVACRCCGCSLLQTRPSSRDCSSPRL